MSTAVLAAWCGQAVSIAHADLPPAMDRVPADAQGAVAIRNLSTFHQRVAQYMELFHVPLEGSPVEHMDHMLNTPGVNKEGSAVVVMLPHPEGEQSDKYHVVIAPVSDFKAFSEAMKGEGTGIVKAKFDENDVYMKDAGGGYIVMGPDQEVVQGFTAAKGSTEKLKQAMGASGVAAADTADVVVYLTMAIVKPGVEEAGKKMKEQAQTVAAMTGGQGPDMTAMSKIAETMSQDLERDGQAVVATIGADDLGLTIDLIAQFKEGSEAAKRLQIGGSAGSISSALPEVNYLFAGSVDTSSPMVKSWMKEAQQEGAAAAKKDLGPWTAVMASMDNVDGIATMIGLPPSGMMGGLLTASSMFVKTKDPQGFVDGLKAGIESINGQPVGEAKATSSYKAAAVEAGGTKVDKWSLSVPMGADDPSAAMMQQVNMVLYGGMTPAGLVGKTDSGVVMTLSDNSLLMGAAMQSAKSGKGFSAQESVSAVQAKLPQGRMFEMYVGVKGLVDMVGPFIAMQTGAAPPKTPDHLAPVAFAGTMNGGAAGMRMVVPRDVLKTIGELVNEFGHEGDEAGDQPEADAPDAKKRTPRF